MKKQTIALLFVFFLILIGGFAFYKIFPDEAIEQVTHQDELKSPREWSVEDASSQPLFTSMEPSPDGKYTLVAQKYPPQDDEKQQPLLMLSLIENKSHKVIWKTPLDKNFQSPQWSSDGNYVSFLSFNEKNIPTLQITPFKTFAPQIALEMQGLAAYFWSPDSHQIALISRDIKRTESLTIEEGMVFLNTEDEIEKTNLLILSDPLDKKNISKHVPLKDSTIPEVFSKPEMILTWSRDGDSLVFVSEGKKEGLFSVDLKSLRIEQIHQGGHPSYPVFSPDGKYLAYVANVAKETDLFPIKRRALFIYDLETKKTTKQLETPLGNPILLGWFADSQALLVEEGYKTLRRLYKVPLHGESVEVLNKENDQLISKVSLNSSSTHIGFVLESLTEEPAASISSIESFGPRPLFNQFLITLPLQAEVIKWPSFDGKIIEGILVYPLDYKKGARYPLITALHEGPYGAWEQKFLGGCANNIYPFSPAVFASKGYAILLPNIRGSSNYGIDFTKAIDKDIGGKDFKDLMAGIDFVIEKGVADPEKLVIWGWKYGGYLAAHAITQTNRFKSAIIGLGMTDLISFSETAKDNGFLKSYLGGTFWENKDLWLIRSPIMHVEKIQTPTLLLYGKQPNLFPTGQGKELYYALKKRGVPVKMLLFTNEEEEVNLSSRSIKAGLEHTIAWLEQFLSLDPNNRGSSDVTHKKENAK